MVLWSCATVHISAPETFSSGWKGSHTTNVWLGCRIVNMPSKPWCFYVPQFIRTNMRKPFPGSPRMARGFQVPEQHLNISVQGDRKGQILVILLWHRRHFSLHWGEKNPHISTARGSPPAQQTAEMSQSRLAEHHQTNSILIALTAVFWAALSTFLPHTGCFSMFSCLAKFPPSSPEHF